MLLPRIGKPQGLVSRAGMPLSESKSRFLKVISELESEQCPGVLLEFHGQWASENDWIVIIRNDQSVQIAHSENPGSWYKRNRETGLIVPIKLDWEAMHNGVFLGSSSFHPCPVLCPSV